MYDFYKYDDEEFYKEFVRCKRFLMSGGCDYFEWIDDLLCWLCEFKGCDFDGVK